ncbi:hypothetical protein EBI_26268 [Enterocytozoon bieneusi H348]|nr:hypothetical protein EBI_26268 [Enterocytozoon bieneusi H348]|eukprot:XP_002650935.1 hypothetical protein EBI_26268 [Enterocytozoon bieneusi H348]
MAGPGPPNSFPRLNFRFNRGKWPPFHSQNFRFSLSNQIPPKIFFKGSKKFFQKFYPRGAPPV